MLLGLDDKFREYVCAREVRPEIPDDLLRELKEINERYKEVMGKDLFDFPR